MKNKKIGKYNFNDFDESLQRQMKDPKFRMAYKQELSHLRIAHELRELRKRRKLTQEQVAQKVEMPQSVIARIESGSRNVSVTTLSKIASVFDRRIGIVE